MTNLERIRQISEALAKELDVIAKCTGWQCKECILRDAERCNANDIREWLESEVKE